MCSWCRRSIVPETIVPQDNSVIECKRANTLAGYECRYASRRHNFSWKRGSSNGFDSVGLVIPRAANKRCEPITLDRFVHPQDQYRKRGNASHRNAEMDTRKVSSCYRDFILRGT